MFSRPLFDISGSDTALDTAGFLDTSISGSYAKNYENRRSVI